jgi:hypothetical protein
MRYWIAYQGDLDLAKVTSSHITRYLNYLRTEYEPRWITGGNDQKLSGKTLRNYWMTFSDDLRKSPRFEVQRQGGGLDMVRIKD